MKDRYYFAYGRRDKNMKQKKYRCRAAEVGKTSSLKLWLAFRGRATGNGVATVLRKKEAMSKEYYGKSQKRVRRVWIFMKDSQVFMGKNRFGLKNEDRLKCLYI